VVVGNASEDTLETESTGFEGSLCIGKKKSKVKTLGIFFFISQIKSK
jgi:hypothetical protein